MGGTSGPYTQTLGYDEFDHLTSRSTTTDGTTRSFTAGFTNNRKSWGGYGSSPFDVFDSAGNVTYNKAYGGTLIDQRFWKFDVAGRVTDWLETSLYAGSTHHEQGEVLMFDGDGRTVRRLKKSRIYGSGDPFFERPEYYIYSSVTGNILVELDGNGNATKRNVYFNGSVIAEETPGFGFVFKHNDPKAGSEMQTELSGLITPNEIGHVERAAMGEVIPTTEPELITPPHNYGKGASTDNPQKCMENGFPTECGELKDSLRAQGLLAGDMLIIHTIGVIPALDFRRVSLGMEIVDFGRQVNDIDRVKADIQKVRDTLTQKCRDALKGFLLDAVRKAFPDLTTDPAGLKFYEDQILGLGDMLDGLTKGSITSSAVHRNDQVTDTIYNNRNVATFARSGGKTSLDVGTKYFYDIGYNRVRTNSDPRYYLSDRKASDRMYTIIHEAIHSIVGEFSDEFFAELLSNGDIKATDKNAHDKGSKMLTEKIKELCPSQ